MSIYLSINLLVNQKDRKQRWRYSVSLQSQRDAKIWRGKFLLVVTITFNLASIVAPVSLVSPGVSHRLVGLTDRHLALILHLPSTLVYWVNILEQIHGSSPVHAEKEEEDEEKEEEKPRQAFERLDGLQRSAQENSWTGQRNARMLSARSILHACRIFHETLRNFVFLSSVFDVCPIVRGLLASMNFILCRELEGYLGQSRYKKLFV